MTTISVLTLVKNRSGHLLQLLEGLNRSARAPAEVIIVDMSDHPVDEPVTSFPCRVLRLEGQGLPLAKARNVAAREARGDDLLFLDVDCIPMRGLIDAMVRALSEHDALVCAEVRYLGPEDARGEWTESQLRAIATPHPVRSFPASGLRVETNPGLFWSLAFGLHRRRFMSLGGFDERFRGYGAEDTDFGFRARDAGTDLLFLGGPGAFHQYHDIFDPPLQHFDDIVRNAQIFHERWQTWPMTGWLTEFESMGLIILSKDILTIIRRPTLGEIASSKI